MSWMQFQQRFMKNSLVYVIENLDDWTLYTSDGMIILKAVVPKHEVPEQNIAFVDRHLNETNICKCNFADEQLKVQLNLVQQ